MLHKLTIQNFQSHKNTQLEFSPGVNVIVGTSDSGKSAILRALRWALWNRPLGDAFRSHWGGDTSVSIQMEDCGVERFKGKGGDKYVLAQEDEFEPIEFKAFGTDVPEDVKQALALTELNIQSQHDNSFLLSNNPGEVARHFNRIARIDKIDSSLTKIESSLRAVKRLVEASENEIQRHEKELKDFEYLDKMEVDVEVLESLYDQKLRTYKDIQNLDTTIIQIETTDVTITELSGLLPAEAEVDALLAMADKSQDKRKQFRELKILVLEVIGLEKGIEEYEELIGDETLVILLLDLYIMSNAVQTKQTELEKLLTQYQDTEYRIELHTETLTKLEKDWHEAMPDVCPLCGRS